MLFTERFLSGGLLVYVLGLRVKYIGIYLPQNHDADFVWKFSNNVDRPVWEQSKQPKWKLRLLRRAHFSERLASSNQSTWRSEHNQTCQHCENFKSHTNELPVEHNTADYTEIMLGWLQGPKFKKKTALWKYPLKHIVNQSRSFSQMMECGHE